jgi:hypothetical protein
MCFRQSFPHPQAVLTNAHRLQELFQYNLSAGCTGGKSLPFILPLWTNDAVFWLTYEPMYPRKWLLSLLRALLFQ